MHAAVYDLSAAPGVLHRGRATRAAILQRMRILYAASEVYPFSKTGGLADVAGALPAALTRLGAELLVVSPWYASLKARPYWIGDIPVPFDGRFESAGIGTMEQDGIRYAFIGHPDFSRAEYYGYPDDVRRFSLFTRAIPQAAERLGFKPDLVHVNDWHTAYLPLVLSRGWHLPPGFSGLPSLLTIHNVQYQGESGLDEATWWLRLPRDVRDSWMNRLGQANALQAGLGEASHVNTVSPTYAREIQGEEYGYGLDASFREISSQGRLSGILNGLDTAVWDPATDANLQRRFGPDSIRQGKRAAKEALCSRFGLDPDRPLLAAVSRLADQKGMDVLLESVPGLLEQGWSLFVLGSGDRVLEERFGSLAEQEPQVAARLGFDESLAHLTYAAADVLAIPSRFEPCGLSQMIAMRYGTLPLARATGGLNDTIDHLKTGFLFEHSASWSLLGTAGLARDLYGRAGFAAMQSAAMDQDFSWEASARRYRELYSVILGE